MACEAIDPETGARCVASSLHDMHYGTADGLSAMWTNEDFVPPPPKTKGSFSRGEARLRDKAQKAQRPVDDDVMDIGVEHPETSHRMREHKIGDTGTQRRRIYDLTVERGDLGITDDEAETMLGLLHQSASAARNSLVKDGWLVDSGITRPTRSKEQAIVWIAVPEN